MPPSLPPPPRSLIFEITTRCQFDCLHCYNVWKNAAPYPCEELPTRETLDLLDRLLVQTGVRHVTLTGGEPLLRADWRDIVTFLRARDVTVNLICNGGLLDADAIAWCRGGKIGIFELPLLSSDRAIHDRMSGFPGAFDRVTRAIADLKLAGERVVVVFVATRLNLPTWESTMDLAFALGVDGVMFNRFNPGGRGFQNLALLQASPAEVQSALAIAETKGKEFDLPVSCSIAMPPCLFDLSGFTHLTFGFCGAGTDRAYYTLDPVGNLRPCNHSPTILGNLARASFADLATGPRMAAFLDARPALCGGCPRERTCLGGCKAAGEACFGSPWEPDPFLRAFAAGRRQVPP